MTVDYATRATALVGTRFRLQGRGEGGLDCVGVVLATFGIPSDAGPQDYRLRGIRLADVRAALETQFRRVRKAELRAGDVMLLDAGYGQLHLGVRTSIGFVHAHAGIRRVVETPGLPQWPLLGVYRRRRSH